MKNPDYFNPDHFAKGESVSYGDFKGSIVRHYYEGMWEVRLPGGIACVSGSQLRRIQPA
jgi:hypothetical protein